MGDLFTALKDNQHLVLIGAAVWAYFKWQEKRRELMASFEHERRAHREATEEVIRASLANGIGQRIREILAELLRDHERSEQINLERAIASFRTENVEAHKMIGQRQSDVEQRVAVMESKWSSVLGPNRSAVP